MKCVKDNLIITDDTRELNNTTSPIVFLETPQNKPFLEKVDNRKNIKIISRDNLKEYFKTDIKIIGITGTNGKTTTAAAIYSMLLDLGIKTALLGTRGMFINDKRVKEKGLTTPDILSLYSDIDLAIESKCEYFVMEVSSHAIKQERIYGLDFFMKILTNITSDHLDYHRTWQDYADTKLEFMKKGNCLKVVNVDDLSGAKIRFIDNAFCYGIDSKLHLFVNAYSLKDGIFANITLRENKDKAENATLQTHLVGLFNLYNFLAAIFAVRLATSKDLQAICNVLAKFGGVSGRMEVISTTPLIVIDFAHTEDGMEKVFDSFKGRNISVVFGAGGDRDRGKRAKMGALAALRANRIYITNDNPRSENPSDIADEILKGVEKIKESGIRQDIAVQIILDRKEAINTAIKELEKDSILLVLGKGDETKQIFRDKEIYFSDRECVIGCLESKQ